MACKFERGSQDVYELIIKRLVILYELSCCIYIDVLEITEGDEMV